MHQRVQVGQFQILHICEHVLVNNGRTHLESWISRQSSSSYFFRGSSSYIFITFSGVYQFTRLPFGPKQDIFIPSPTSFLVIFLIVAILNKKLISTLTTKPQYLSDIDQYSTKRSSGYHHLSSVQSTTQSVILDS